MEPPIDKGWAWVALVGVWISCFISVGGLKCLGILFVEFIQLYETSNSMTAWAMGVVLLCLAIGAPTSTRLGEYSSNRMMVCIGGVLLSLGLIVAAIVDNIILLICVFSSITGLGFGAVYATSTVVVTMYFEKKRPLATAVAVSGSSVGQLVTPILLRTLIDAYGLRGALVISAAINLNIVVGGALMRPFSFYRSIGKKKKGKNLDINGTELSVLDKKGKRYSHDFKASTGSLIIKHEKDNEDAKVDGTDARQEEKHLVEDTEAYESLTHRTCYCKCSKICDFSLFSKRVFIIFVIGLCLDYIGYINPIIFLPAYAKDLGVNQFNRALLISLMGICDFIGRIITGLFANTKFMKGKSNILFAVMQGLSGIILILATLLNMKASAVIICISHGAFAGTIFSLHTVVVCDFLGRNNLSAGVGLSFLCLGLTQAGMPALLGMLRDTTGNYMASLYLCGTAGFIGSIFFMFIPMGKRMDDKHQEKKDELRKQKMEEQVHHSKEHLHHSKEQLHHSKEQLHHSKEQLDHSPQSV